MLEVIVGILVQLRQPHNFFGEDGLAIHNCGNLHVGTASIEADTATVHVTADGLSHLVALGACFQGQIQNLQITLIELVYKVKVEVTVTLGGICLLQTLSQLAAAADGNTEAAGGPQQELHIALNIAVVSFCHFGSTVDKGLMYRNTALVTLQSDSQGLGSALQVSGTPYTKRNKGGVQLGGMFHLIFDS